jgi:putative transposase
MRIRTLNHSTYQHQYHIVWGTRYHRKILKEYTREPLAASIKKTLEKYPTLYLIKVNVGGSHVHIQIEIPPNIAVCKAVQVIKQNSSIDLKKRFKYIDKLYLEGSIWAVGYFSSTIGLNEELIKRYIDQQTEEDLSKPSKLEFS